MTIEGYYGPTDDCYQLDYSQLPILHSSIIYIIKICMTFVGYGTKEVTTPTHMRLSAFFCCMGQRGQYKDNVQHNYDK